ncbi:MAG TPA: MOSC domain-containing protein [Actinomycetes bacterium]|nr:MOSC domain-containing protein [Actinomycetes bacterium]
MPGLLELSATLDGDGPAVTFPDGRRPRAGAALDEALAAYVGRVVQLAEEREIPHHDAAPVHPVTDASCREVGAEPAAFRANVVIDTHGADGLVEDTWVDAVLRVGSAGVRLRVTGTTERCVMIGSETLRAVADRNDLQLGIYAEVLEPGLVREGDEVRLT